MTLEDEDPELASELNIYLVTLPSWGLLAHKTEKPYK